MSDAGFVCKQCRQRGKKKYARDLCRTCYHYQWRNGKPRTEFKRFVTEKDISRFLNRLMSGDSLTTIANVTGFDTRTIKHHLLTDEGIREKYGEHIDRMLKVRNRIRVERPLLTTRQAEQVRTKRRQGRTIKSLAEEYGVSISNISRICNRKLYVVDGEKDRRDKTQKLSPDEILELRELRRRGYTYGHIANMTGRNMTTVARFCHDIVDIADEITDEMMADELEFDRMDG